MVFFMFRICDSRSIYSRYSSRRCFYKFWFVANIQYTGSQADRGLSPSERMSKKVEVQGLQGLEDLEEEGELYMGLFALSPIWSRSVSLSRLDTLCIVIVHYLIDFKSL